MVLIFIIVITDYVNFCMDNVVTKKQVIIYLNNKVYIAKIKHCINRKKNKKINKKKNSRSQKCTDWF